MITARRGGRGIAVLASLLLLAACGSSGGRADRTTASTTAADHAGHDAHLGGQYTAEQARLLPDVVGADAAALRRLSRGRVPDEQEVAAATDAMASLTPPRSPFNATDVERRAAAAALERARTAVQRWPTVAAARRDGFRIGSRFLPGVGAHWIDWSKVTQPFDPAKPSMLLFDGDTPDARIVGLSYYTLSAEEPQAFRADGAVWHRHAGLCIVHGALVTEGLTDRAACDQGRGSLIPGRNVWMLHVWVVPDHPNSLGLYAPLNPGLCSETAPCTPDGSMPGPATATGSASAAPTTSTTTTTTAGAAAGHDHREFDTPQPHEDVDGLAAWQVGPVTVEVSRYPRTAKPSARQRARSGRLVRDTLTTLRRFRNLQAARKAGYIPMPDDPIHWYQPDYLTDDRILDPRRPEFLVFVDPQRSPRTIRSDESEAQLAKRKVVGAMFWMPETAAHGPQPGGPLTVWHFHEWTPTFMCGTDDGFPLATPNEQTCPAGVPIGRSAEMLHVWGVKTPAGRFATDMNFLEHPARVLRAGYLE